MLAGSIPRNILFLANLRILPSVPWAVPVLGLYMWAFWQYLNGKGPPQATAELRCASLRAGPVQRRVWAWSLLAGGLGIVALVLACGWRTGWSCCPRSSSPIWARYFSTRLWLCC